MSTGLLDVRSVARRFGGVQALRDVSLTVREGTIVGLIGPNGAGKTTLFNVISGLLPPDAGTITFAGSDITSLAPYRRAGLGIGRSFQNLGLMLDETALNNILAAMHRSADYTVADVIIRPWRRIRAERQLATRARQSLRSFGLTADAQRRVADLSFAKARFVELAAVVAEEPRLMLLDEPTTGLDPVEVDRLAGVLAEIRSRGTTMLIVAHDVGFVMRMCDHVYVLAEGRLLFDGPPLEVQSNQAVVDAYLGRTA